MIQSLRESSASLYESRSLQLVSSKLELEIWLFSSSPISFKYWINILLSSSISQLFVIIFSLHNFKKGVRTLNDSNLEVFIAEISWTKVSSLCAFVSVTYHCSLHIPDLSSDISLLFILHLLLDSLRCKFILSNLDWKPCFYFFAFI